MNKKLALLISIFAVLGVFAAYYFLHVPAKQGMVLRGEGVEIVPYDGGRDRSFIKEIFAHDLHWLAADPQYDVDFLLDKKSPRRDPRLFGKERIRILFVAGKPAGFTSYYMKNFYEGWVHFLDILPAYRGHGYAKQLLSYAMNALFNEEGAKVVKILTRNTNAPALHIYKKFGFTQTHKDDMHTFFIMKREVWEEKQSTRA